MKSTLQERQQNEKHGEHLYNNANPYKKKNITNKYKHTFIIRTYR